jgi:hypothetical protein
MQAGAADEAGKFIALGGMTNQSRRFVDDQQAGVFVDDVERVFQTRGDFNHGWTRIFKMIKRRNHLQPDYIDPDPDRFLSNLF